MAIDVGELRAVLTLKDDFSKPVNDAAKELGFFGKSFGAITGVLGLGVGAITAAGAAIVALGNHGAAVGDVSDSFDDLTAAAGATRDEMLGGLRAGVQGTISDFELMKLANRALGSGLVTSSGDMETLAAGARGLAKATGGDTKQAFETLMSSIASGRTTALKQMGLFVDTKRAVDDYAKSLGVSTSSLTDEDRAHAVATASLKALHERFKDRSPADFGEMIQAGRVYLENFRNDLSVAIASSPVVMAGMRAIGESIAGAFSGDQQGRVRTLVGYVNDFAIWIAKAAQAGVVGAQFLVNAFQGTKVIFNEVLGAIAGGVGRVIEGWAVLAEKASELPGIGPKLKPIAEGLRSGSDMAKSLAYGFSEIADEALDSAAATNAGFEKVKTGIGGVITEMKKAAGEQVKVNKTVRDLSKDTGDAAKAAERDTKAIKAHFQKLQNDLTLANRIGVDRRLREAEIAYRKELADLENLKGLTIQERAAMTVMIEAGYRKQVAAAKLSADQIRDTKQKLDADLRKAQATGLEATLLAIEEEQAQEIKGLENLKLEYAGAYDEIAAKIGIKYNGIKQAAVETGLAEVEQALKTKGQTVDAARETLDNALALNRQLQASDAATAAQRIRSEQAVSDAKKQLREAERAAQLNQWAELGSMASSALREIFGKNKAAALASIVIDTAMAIMRVWATPGNYWVKLAQSVLVGAVGAVQFSKASSAHYAQGTPGVDYLDFGAETPGLLHGVEAVVPRARVPALASDIASELGSGGSRGGRPIEITLINALDGRELTRRVIRLMPRELALAGVGTM